MGFFTIQVQAQSHYSVFEKKLYFRNLVYCLAVVIISCTVYSIFHLNFELNCADRSVVSEIC